MHRIKQADGTFVGAVGTNGDSGSPLLLHGGTATGDVPELAGLTEGPFFVIGAESGGDQTCSQQGQTGCLPAGQPLPNTFDTDTQFPSTFTSKNGPWIDQAIKELIEDTDGDGIKNWADNCPYVANPNQEDTNYIAEFVDEQNRGCTDFPNAVCPTLHQLPTSDDAFAAAFHAFFPGDACDQAVSTETGRTGVTFGDGVVGPPCVVVQISGNQTSSHLDYGASCEHQLDTQLRFASWTGDTAGNASNAGTAGGTTPTFCRCDGASTGSDGDQSAIDCSTSTPQGGAPCVVADDTTLPGGIHSGSGGWQPLTERVIPTKPTAPFDTPFPSVTSTFQERVGVYPDLSVTHNWDMLADWNEFYTGVTFQLVALDGIMWSHVNEFGLSSSYAGARDGSSLVSNLDNHYFPMLTRESYGLRFQIIVPPAFHFHIGGWFDGADGDPGPGDPVLLPWFAFTTNSEVVRLLGSSGDVATSSFSTGALSLLSGVASGTSDLLVGDDVATGIMHATTPYAAVVVQHNTTTVQGALRVQNGRAVGVMVSPIGTSPDPPDLRAYDAYDAALYSLHVDTTGDTLTNVDVAAALGGVSHVTPTAVVGVQPVAPLAFVWDRFVRTLFVLDKVSIDHHAALRLVAIDPLTSQGYEVWRTSGGNDFPHAALLSVSAQGEVVLTLDTGKAEVILFDAGGAPHGSAASTGTPMDAAFAVPAGINLPVAPGVGDKLGVRIDLLRRGDLSPSLCGSSWLRHHAAGTLATYAAACH